MGCCFCRRRTPDDVRSLLSNSRKHWVNISERDFPGPFPPKNRKDDLYPGEFYLAVDRFASTVPRKKLQVPISDLGSYLVRKCKTDVECARILFRYVANTDINGVLEKFNLTANDNSALDYFSRMQNHSCNHAILYRALAKSVGIPCVLINGISKNSEYVIGESLDTKALAHQWNAVYLDNQWRLVDTLWGSACMLGERSSHWSIINVDGVGVNQPEDAERGKKCRLRNNFFFLTDPDMMVCTHLPDDPAWQLLPQPVSFKQFEEFVYVREKFSQIGLHMLPASHQLCNVKSNDGEVCIEFGIPPNKAQLLLFKYLLFFRTNGKPKRMHNFDNIVLFEITEDKVSFRVWLPFSGKFRFEVFCCEEDNGRERFDLAFSYVIHCSMPKQNFSGLPITPEIGWGPGPAAKKAGFKALSHHSAVVHANSGRVQIRFKMKNKVGIHCELKSQYHTDAELEKYLITYTDNDELVIDVRLPEQGQFALCIYASEAGKKDSPSNVCNYLLKNPVSLPNCPFPKTADGTLGCNTYNCETLKVTCAQTDPVMSVKTSPITIDFTCDDSTQILPHLDCIGMKQSELTQYLSSTREDNVVSIKLTLHAIGEYTLNVYARKPSFSQIIHHIQTVLIRNRIEDSDVTQMQFSAEDVSAMTPLTIHTVDNQIRIEPMQKDKDFVVASFRKCTVQGIADQADLTMRENEMILELPEYADYSLNEFSVVKTNILQHVRSHRVRRLEEEEEATLTIVNETSLDKLKATKPPSLQLLRTLLRMALVTNSEQLITAAIARVKANRFENEVPEMRKAKRKLKIFSTQHTLTEAIRSRNIIKLETVIDAADRDGLSCHLGIKMVLARQILDKQLKDKIQKMNQGAIAEVKSYQAPPEVVKSVMQALFILLGQEDKEVAEWESIRRTIGDTYKMKAKLKERRASSIPREKLERARSILGTIEASKVRRVSEVASTFFAWSSNILKMTAQEVTEEEEEEPVD